MFGGTPQRNMVNTTDTNLPATWSVEEGKQKNIKWVAEIGNKTHGSPVVADGKVFVGTNNGQPRDQRIKGREKAVLMAFNEADGKFLWQIVHDIPDNATFSAARGDGLFSAPVVEGNRLWYVTPSCVVVCADTSGKIQWSFDMMKELKVVPYHCNFCSPLVVGELLMVATGNGINDETGKVVAPDAPSFVALNKTTGKLVWQSNLPGNAIIEGQWSSPVLAVAAGREQVIFSGGDCVLYSFEPATGKLVWKCNCNPHPKKRGGREIDNYIIATPVIVGERLYIGLGPHPEHPAGTRFSHMLCLDITRQGDVSLKSYDARDPANKGSALVWAFGGAITSRSAPAMGTRKAFFGSTISTACVHDGLVYIPEERGYLHCLDAKTGQRYWEHDFKASVWGSALYADGKLYVALDEGTVVVFRHGKGYEVLATNDMDECSLHTTPVAANGVLYVATRSKLYAIAAMK
jgi:outer membrane protein assembly factor BamB